MRQVTLRYIMTTLLAGLAVSMSQSIYAVSDQFLIKRSSRPLMAESSYEALQPWETPTEGFFIRTHHDSLPVSVNDSWEVSLEGLLRTPQKISLKDLKKMPQSSFYAVLECSGNGRGLFAPPVSGIQWKRGAVGNAQWTGVMLRDLIKDLGVKPEAIYATLEGADEPVIPSDTKFVRSVPVELLIKNDAMLAFDMNRAPIPVAHGGPVRLVVPNIYGQNWIKWLNRIVFSRTPDERTYAKKAYRMPSVAVKPGEAWDPMKNGKPVEYIKVQSIFTSPEPGAVNASGKLTLSGKAFSGSGPIAKVEISFDGGRNWVLAKISEPKDFAWQEFWYELEAKDQTHYEALSRATDSAGNIQPLTQEWNPKGYLYHSVDRLTFQVSNRDFEADEGRKLVSTHCLTCHSADLISQQSLGQKAWEGTVKKMSDYGLKLGDGEVIKIATWLASRKQGTSAAGEEKYVDLGLDSNIVMSPPKKGSIAHGRKLFASHCSACHGTEGGGRIAPHLKKRALTDAAFWTTAVHGKRQMPAFEKTLSKAQISDIRAWLQHR